MLVEFTVRNFRSLRDEQTLSFVASSDKSRAQTHCIETGVKNLPLLTRAAVIYGANASGKSNLIFALATMRNMVMQSMIMPEPVRAEQYTPFRLDASTSSEPTALEVLLLLDGTRYHYGFSYDAQRIHDEWLVVYKKGTGKGQTWFDRSWNARTNEYEWAPFSTYFTGTKETWKQATRPNALFLTTAIQLNNEQMKPLWNWFLNEVAVLNWAGSGAALGIGKTLRRLEDADFKKRVLEVMRAADLHLADIQVEQQPGHQVEFKLEPGKPLEFSARDQEVPVVKYVHRVEGQDAVSFDSRFESFGTQRLLSYIGPLLDALENGRLLVIDEIDSSLHPMVVRFLLNLFHNPLVSTKGAQLWMTTHDSSLLDVELLRRDQYWFVEKDSQQASKLYPLTDFSPRKGEALEKAYLRARYGGVPSISSANLH
jgi:uncharacterized protein